MVARAVCIGESTVIVCLSVAIDDYLPYNNILGALGGLWVWEKLASISAQNLLYNEYII